MKKRVLRLIAAALTCFVLLGALPTAGFADEFDDELEAITQKREQAANNRQEAQNKLDALKEEQAAIIEEKMALEQRNIAAQEEIDAITEEIGIYNLRIALKEQDVAAAAGEEAEQLNRYRVRVRAMEESGGYNILTILFNSDSLAGMIAAIDDYREIMESDKKLYDELQAAREAHEEIEQEFVTLKEECEGIKDGLEAEKADLETQIAETEALIEELGEAISQAEEELKAMELAEAAAANSVAGFLANYYKRQQAQAQQAQQNAGGANIEAGNTGTEGSETGGSTVTETGGSDGTVLEIDPNGGTSAPAATETTTTPAASTTTTTTTNTNTNTGSTTTTTTTTNSNTTGTGSCVWPFPGHYNITSPFGYRSSTGTNHTGVDIDGYQSAGSPIVAADSGTVIFAAYNGGYGNCIMIDHGDKVTVYAHLNFMNVGVGSVVSKGQTIGGVGNTGTCYGLDGVHLHFEVRINNVAVDPMGYI